MAVCVAKLPVKIKVSRDNLRKSAGHIFLVTRCKFQKNARGRAKVAVAIFNTKFVKGMKKCHREKKTLLCTGHICTDYENEAKYKIS